MTVIVITSFKTNISHHVTGIVYDGITSKRMPNVIVKVKGKSESTKTDQFGRYEIDVPSKNSYLTFEKIGYETLQVPVAGRTIVEAFLVHIVTETEVEEIIIHRPEAVNEIDDASHVAKINHQKKNFARQSNSNLSWTPQNSIGNVQINTEEYASVKETGFLIPQKSPYSTFSIDVDVASYSNVRRFLNNGQRPPVDAVRVEEMINYFEYDYQGPKSAKNPFAIHTEVALAPWNRNHQLIHIGLQGKRIDHKELPPSNLVFLIDVSGSMNAANKLPLLKSAFRLLTKQLRPEDKVSIIVYAGAAGLVLAPTSGDESEKIIKALDNLQAGGSTAGGAGIELAYKKAKEHFVENGNNRVILATDGDFNVGESSNTAMEKLIEQKRKDGIYLTVLGFGMGDYKDAKMEILADKGNGNYAYIDNILEAKKVLVNEFGGTLFTIAKDVKIQVEFNPQNVQAYRLIGYENRRLQDEDFNDDQKDAGELGAGHSVTALYEVIPVGVNSNYASIDPLKYQAPKPVKNNGFADDLMTVKLRYKDPQIPENGQQDKSKLISRTITKHELKDKNLTNNFKWSATIAAYGMILKESEYKGDITMEEVVEMARSSRGVDKEGYRIECIRLMESSMLLVKNE